MYYEMNEDLHLELMLILFFLKRSRKDEIRIQGLVFFKKSWKTFILNPETGLLFLLLKFRARQKFLSIVKQKFFLGRSTNKSALSGFNKFKALVIKSIIGTHLKRTFGLKSLDVTSTSVDLFTSQ